MSRTVAMATLALVASILMAGCATNHKEFTFTVAFDPGMSQADRKLVNGGAELTVDVVPVRGMIDKSESILGIEADDWFNPRAGPRREDFKRIRTTFVVSEGRVEPVSDNQGRLFEKDGSVFVVYPREQESIPNSELKTVVVFANFEKKVDSIRRHRSELNVNKNPHWFIDVMTDRCDFRARAEDFPIPQQDR